MKRFLARTARLADTDARAAALVELDRNLADHVASALERNVRRWHEALAPVGAAALARLALDLGCGAVAAEARDAPRKSLGLELAGWIHVTKVCAREYLPWAFDRVAEDAWLREFESRRDALSARLKNRHRAREMTPADARGVARVFVRIDLASYRERVVVRFVTLVISLALAVALAACVRASLRFFPRPRPRATARAGAMPRLPRTTRRRVAAAANDPRRGSTAGFSAPRRRCRRRDAQSNPRLRADATASGRGPGSGGRIRRRLERRRLAPRGRSLRTFVQARVLVAHAHTFHHLLLGRSSRRILSRIRPEIFPRALQPHRGRRREDVDPRPRVEMWSDGFPGRAPAMTTPPSVCSDFTITQTCVV